MSDSANKNPLSSSKLVNGVAILAIAAVISKLLGTMQKIPLQNIGGDEVFGIYNAVFPFYTLILFLATAGFPVAVSKFVSEFTAAGNLYEARRVLRISTMFLTITGVVFFLLAFFGAGFIAELIGDGQTKLAIQSIAIALVFVPPMAALRGYFQGMQNMIPTGVSQVIEQLIRVGTMVVLLLYFTKISLSVEWIAAGATLGTSTGAIAGLAVMLLYKVRDLKKKKHSVMPVGVKREALGSLVKRMLMFAIPVCLGAIVVPILSIVDAFTIPRMLQQTGLSASEAMHQFGVYARGLPLVQLVAMLFSSLSVALVPSIAEARQRRAWSVIQQRAELSLRLTWLVGWAASCGLALLAVPINRMLFMDEAGSLSMAILAFTAIFSVINIISASILQGVGRVVIPAMSLLIAAVIKVGLNVLWIPNWGIEGAAIAAVITFLIASLINLFTIRKVTGLHFKLRFYIVKPVIALALMSLALWLWMLSWTWLGQWLSIDLSHRGIATMVSLSSVIVGAIVFFLAILRLGVINIKELYYIPKLGEKLIPILQKIRILR